MNINSLDTSVTVLNAAQGRTTDVANDTKYARDIKRIEETAQDFEAMFVSEMIKPMFAGIETDGPFGGGKGEEVFRGFLLSEYGKMVAKSGTIGIADHVKAEMIRLQETQGSTSTNTGVKK